MAEQKLQASEPESGPPSTSHPGAHPGGDEHLSRLSMKRSARVLAWALTLGFLYVAWPLLLPMAMGAVFAVLFMPLIKRLEKRGLSTSLASVVLTLGVGLLVLLPVSAILLTLARAAIEQIQGLREVSLHFTTADDSATDVWSRLLQSPRLTHLLDKITEWIPVPKEQLVESGQEMIRSIMTRAAEVLGGLASHLPGMAMALTVIVVSLYFFLVDGRRLVEFLRRSSVVSPQQTERLLGTAAIVCRSVVLASLVSGVAQALIEFLACVVTGVPNAGLVAVLVFLGSFVPLIGSMPVTLFVATQQLFVAGGHTGVAIALFVAAAIVSMIDNLVRPLFLRGSANLHPLLAFVAAFGGLQMLGFLGIFLGPIIAALFVTMIQLLVSERT